MEQVRLKLIEARAAIDAAIASLPVEREDAKTPLLVWGAKVPKDFREGVWWIERDPAGAGVKANNLMAVMAFETGVSFSPSVKNPASSATGLIQFMRATAIQLGTTVEALARMTQLRQLGWVNKYFQQFGTRAQRAKWDLADTYMAVLLPSMIGKPLDAKMAWSQAAYNVNKGLDTNKDGVVTKREAYEKVRLMFELGSKPENMA